MTTYLHNKHYHVCVYIQRDIQEFVRSPGRVSEIGLFSSLQGKNDILFIEFVQLITHSKMPVDRARKAFCSACMLIKHNRIHILAGTYIYIWTHTIAIYCLFCICSQTLFFSNAIGCIVISSWLTWPAGPNEKGDVVANTSCLASRGVKWTRATVGNRQATVNY